MSEAKPAVIVISSLVARGAVGGRAALTCLERLGFPVWLVPTVVLPWHPGHGRAARGALPAEEFAAVLADLAGAKWLGEVGAVLTGYLGHAAQAGPIAALVSAVKARNPRALYLCDPVMGDARPDQPGALYVPEPTAVAIRDQLAPLADILTPNRFELGWLTGRTVATTAEAIAAARLLAAPTVLATSAPAMMANAFATLLVTATEAVQAEHPGFASAPNGTGDLFAARFLARILDGATPAVALEKAAATVFEMVARSVRAGADELQLVREPEAIEMPMAQISMRRIAEPRRAG